jgi:hypothetical protein
MDVVQEDGAVSPRAFRTLGHEKRTISYGTADSVDDILQPVSDPALDAELTAHLALKADPQSGPSIDTQALALGNYADVAFGVQIEVLHNGCSIFTAHARWLGASPQKWWFGNMDNAGDWQSTRDYIRANADKPGWTLHISTDQAWALALFDAKRYWKGDLTFPTTIHASPTTWFSPPAAPPKK